MSQGYESNESLIYQDNQSATLLEKNGKASSSKRTRHLNIRYFFITDRIHAKEVKVAYCPTNEMLADLFTKPLQGALFRRLRNNITNIQEVQYDSSVLLTQNHRSVLKSNILNKENVRRNTSNPNVRFKDTVEVRYYKTKYSASTGAIYSVEVENGWTVVQSRNSKRSKIKML